TGGRKVGSASRAEAEVQGRRPTIGAGAYIDVHRVSGLAETEPATNANVAREGQVDAARNLQKRRGEVQVDCRTPGGDGQPGSRHKRTVEIDHCGAAAGAVN